MIRTAIIAAAIAVGAPVAASANDAFECNKAAELAEIFYDDRRAGGDEERARRSLQAAGLQRFAYAASRAYRVPTNVQKWIVKSSVFQQCEDMQRQAGKS